MVSGRGTKRKRVMESKHASPSLPEEQEEGDELARGHAVVRQHQLPAVEEHKSNGQVGEKGGGDCIEAIGSPLLLVEFIVVVQLGAVQPHWDGDGDGEARCWMMRLV